MAELTGHPAQLFEDGVKLGVIIRPSCNNLGDRGLAQTAVNLDQSVRTHWNILDLI